mmetsp:Transcript_21549/g.48972  ORF Transcript_21549/g.48972 Transcript_21549/m.48972 type:complete len:85 (+) Transcript_21549:436-690(+)
MHLSYVTEDCATQQIRKKNSYCTTKIAMWRKRVSCNEKKVTHRRLLRGVPRRVHVLHLAQIRVRRLFRLYRGCAPLVRLFLEVA